MLPGEFNIYPSHQNWAPTVSPSLCHSFEGDIVLIQPWFKPAGPHSHAKGEKTSPPREWEDGAEYSLLRHRFWGLQWAGGRPQSRLERLSREAEPIRTLGGWEKCGLAGWDTLSLTNQLFQYVTWVSECYYLFPLKIT